MICVKLKEEQYLVCFSKQLSNILNDSTPLCQMNNIDVKLPHQNILFSGRNNFQSIGNLVSLQYCYFAMSLANINRCVAPRTRNLLIVYTFLHSIDPQLISITQLSKRGVFYYFLFK